MNPEWIAAPGQDGSSGELAEPREPTTFIMQRGSRIVLADLCVRSAPGMDTNRYQQDAA
jgi:hypothetical protein